MFDTPERIELALDQNVIVPSSDPAASFGFESSAELTVTAFFSRGRSLDITSDAKWVSITTEPSDAVFMYHHKLSINGNFTGVVTVTATYNFFNLSTFQDSQVLTIARSVGISLDLRPYPVSPGSEAISIVSSQIFPRTTIRQNSLLDTTLDLSNGYTISITENASYSLDRQDLATIVGSMVQPNNTGYLIITASFPQIPLFYTNKSLEILDDELSTMEFSFQPEVSTLDTLSGFANSRVNLIGNATFTNTYGAQFLFPELFSNGIPALPGYLTFQSDDDSTISIDSDTGVTTLIKNSVDSMVVLTADNGFSNQSISVYSNLEPELGDVDVGSQTGIPIPPTMVS